MMTDWASFADKFASFIEPLLKSAVAPRLKRNRGWLYQLQFASADDIAAKGAAYVVIDHEAMSAADIKRIQSAGSQVFGYISIGEAEDYRDYWKKMKVKPTWLDKENPEWKGNYKVRFWFPEWQKIVLRQIDRMVENGFDGAYLDIIDAYQYYDRPREMIEFVQAISAAAKALRPDFKIIPQNGSGLLSYPAYRAAIDGIAREDMWFNEMDEGTKNKPSNIDAYVREIKDFIASKDGEAVALSVEYGLTGNDKTYYINSCLRAGMLPLVADRDLANPPEVIT